MLTVRGITKQFGDFSLKNVSFTVNQGDYFILLGESGAGKSMVLETIAGLVKPDSGTILLDDHDITREKIQHRRIGLVFQDHAVFPHLKVRENIAYALHGRKFSTATKKATVDAVSRQLSIDHLLDRRPYALSGGELQRVALARTLVQEPRILLLDEPLASLDNRLKTELRALLRSIHHNGHTLIHVTHDYEEALSLGTRIAIMDKGTVVQEGSPENVLLHPQSEFVAHFAGLRNFFPVTLHTQQGRSWAQTGNLKINLVTEETRNEGYILLRGEDIILSNDPVDTSMTNNFQGKVTEIVLSRYGNEITINIGITLHALVTPGSVMKLGLSIGKEIWVHFKATAVKYIAR